MQNIKKLFFILLFSSFAALQSMQIVYDLTQNQRATPCIKIAGYCGNPLDDVPNFLASFFGVNLFARKEIDVVEEIPFRHEKRLSKSSLISRAFSYAVMIAKNIDRYRDGFEVDGLSIGGQIGIYLIDILNFYRTGKAVDADVARVCRFLEKKFAGILALNLKAKFDQLPAKNILLWTFASPVSAEVDQIANSEQFFTLVKEHVHFFHQKDKTAILDPGICSRKMFMTRNFSGDNESRVEVIVKWGSEQVEPVEAFDERDGRPPRQNGRDYHNDLLHIYEELKTAFSKQRFQHLAR